MYALHMRHVEQIVRSTSRSAEFLGQGGGRHLGAGDVQRAGVPGQVPVSSTAVTLVRTDVGVGMNIGIGTDI